MGRGRHRIDDEAVLKKMASAVLESKISPWEAAQRFASEAGGNSEDSARKRIHRKFLESRERLESEARGDLPRRPEPLSSTVHGFTDEDFECFAEYLLPLENSDRANVITEFLNFRRELRDLSDFVFARLLMSGRHHSETDNEFMARLLRAMEKKRLRWSAILKKNERDSTK